MGTTTLTADTNVTEALKQIKERLGKGLSPNAEPVVRDILVNVRKDGYRDGHQDGYALGFEEAQYSQGDWNRPAPY